MGREPTRALGMTAAWCPGPPLTESTCTVAIVIWQHPEPEEGESCARLRRRWSLQVRTPKRGSLKAGETRVCRVLGVQKGQIGSDGEFRHGFAFHSFLGSREFLCLAERGWLGAGMLPQFGYPVNKNLFPTPPVLLLCLCTVAGG